MQKKHDYNTIIKVDSTAQEAFENISNVAAWWTKNVEGRSEKLNDIFTVRFGETFISIQIIEWIPYSKISWRVIDCYKHWLTNKLEWKDTVMHWEIAAEDDATQISFTHAGLVPGIECYNVCEKAWNFYINESLYKLSEEGKGIPELK